MKVAIINITGGCMSGGYIKYLHNIIPRLASNSAVQSILCASPPNINLQDWFDPMNNVQFVNAKQFRILSCTPDPELKQKLENYLPDVIFTPTERSFLFKNVPIVNMIQNMEPFKSDIEGNPFTEKIKQLIQYIDAKRAIRKADRVIAISRFVYNFLVTRWNISNKKIGLVYHGIDIVRDQNIKRPHSIPKDWNSRFLFVAGSIRPARGLEDLLMALKYILLQGIDNMNIVIAGEADAKMVSYRKKLKNWIEMNNLSDRVCWTGNIEENEMTWCYQNCRAFIMTSLVEACPNIALEALANGCICISTDNPPMPEIFSDAAIYYESNNLNALAEKITIVLDWNTNKQKEMMYKAKSRAADFSWDICAEKTVAELKKTVEHYR